MKINAINSVVNTNTVKNVVSKKASKVSKPIAATGTIVLGSVAGLMAKSAISTQKVSMEEVDKKMRTKVNEILDKEVHLKEGQPLVVKADKQHIPFLKVLAEESYKRGASSVNIEIREPELDKLKAKYLKEPDFEFIKKKEQYFKDNNAATLSFDYKNNPYKLSGLTASETQAVHKASAPIIPERIQKQLEVNPAEIVDTILNLQKGQPLKITAEREHEPNVLKIVEYAYKKGAGPIEVQYSEYGNPFSKAKLKYAKEEYLKEVPSYIAEAWQERVDRKEARLWLDGEDPEGMSDVDPKRLVMQSKATSAVISPIRNSGPESQWNIYYAPTTMSVKSAYPDIKDPMKALEIAAADARKINRTGNLEAHAARLSSVADKVNNLHLDEIHFYSVDPETKKPDGKTDLRIGLTQKAIFAAASEKTDDGIRFLANTPTEEVFSSPDKTRVNGWVSATLPLCLNGNLIEGIKMRFENGKAVEVYADKNQELWREHVHSAEGSDMLGEVALVAGSPIFETGRVFNSTLLDENATCHIAIGRGFDECCDGAKDVTDYKERQNYLAENNVNYSDVHTDFMIGGPNVVVEGTTIDGKKITLIQDNAFQI